MTFVGVSAILWATVIVVGMSPWSAVVLLEFRSDILVIVLLVVVAEEFAAELVLSDLFVMTENRLLMEGRISFVSSVAVWAVVFMAWSLSSTL